MILGFHFSWVSLVYKSSFEEDQRSFVNVSLLQVSDLFAFKLVTLHSFGVRDAELRRTSLKGKVVAT